MFSFCEHIGNYIILKRLKPSYCQVCLRTHEHENPYLFVKPYLNGYQLYFNCRRNTESQLLCFISNKSNTIVDDVTLNQPINIDKYINFNSSPPKKKSDNLLHKLGSLDFDHYYTEIPNIIQNIHLSEKSKKSKYKVYQEYAFNVNV